MVCVLPGLTEILAKFFRLVSRFMSEDLPTLDRPIKANSGLLGEGQYSTEVLLTKNSANLISISS
jgi:hypothetical protein